MEWRLREKEMHKVYLALGSNIGDRNSFIEKAIELLSEKVVVNKCGSIYETKAVGYTDQDNFLNTVVSGKTGLKPKELLSFIKDVEKRLGRVESFPWGPREIDVDILFYDDLVYHDEILLIPHPLIAKRDFVLVPFSEIDEDFMHPVFKKTIKELLKDFPEKDKSIINICM